jgi:dolichol-phosphate mannosyltransferase
MLKNKNNYFLKGYKILFDVIYNSKQKVKIKDIQINFGKRKYGVSKLNSRIVRIFIEQIFYTLKKNFLLNKKKNI